MRVDMLLLTFRAIRSLRSIPDCRGKPPTKIATSVSENASRVLIVQVIFESRGKQQSRTSLDIPSSRRSLPGRSRSRRSTQYSNPKIDPSNKNGIKAYAIRPAPPVRTTETSRISVQVKRTECVCESRKNKRNDPAMKRVRLWSQIQPLNLCVYIFFSFFRRLCPSVLVLDDSRFTDKRSPGRDWRVWFPEHGYKILLPTAAIKSVSTGLLSRPSHWSVIWSTS